MIRFRWLTCALVLLVLLAVHAWAGPPTEQLRGAIDRVLKVLEDPALGPDAKTRERRAAIRKVATDIFDLHEAARRALGHHWQGRTDEEREEFVKLFADLLERSYASRIDRYRGEKIAYVGESLDGDLATVRTKIIPTRGTNVPIDYRMLRRGERWLVYDVSIEGVSLVSNYRTQFNRIIQTSSYPELVKKMKTKQEEFLFEEAGKAKGTAKKQ